MKHILEFINTLGNGGAESLVRDYAIRFKNEANNNCVVFTIFGNKNNQNEQILEKNKIKHYVVYKKINFIKRVMHKLFGDIIISRKLYYIVKKENIDIIHCHLDAIYYANKISKKLKDKKIFYTIHSEANGYAKMAKRDGSIRQLCKYNNFYLIALHNRMAEELKKIYNTNKVQVVYNGINLDRFKNCEIHKEEYRDLLSIPKDAFVVGNVGRFSYPKNHELILKIFVELLKQKENAFLLLVGDGELKEQTIENIKNLGIENRVKILSNRSDIPEILSTMDVFLFPSIFEGFPIAFLEAEAVELQCVISNIIPNEVFTSDMICSLPLSAPIEKWVDSIINFKNNVEKVNDIEIFDIKNVLKNLLCFFEE